jgi:hypothetical protein
MRDVDPEERICGFRVDDLSAVGAEGGAGDLIDQVVEGAFGEAK